MPVNRSHKFRSIDEIDRFLNGAIMGVDLRTGVYGLNGLTLTFSHPAGAVTFTPSSSTDPHQYQLKDIKSQVETAIPSLLVSSANGILCFMERTPTTGVSLSGNNEDAKRILGFDQTSAVVGKVYAPPGAGGGAITAPCWTWIDSTGENQYLVVTWE